MKGVTQRSFPFTNKISERFSKPTPVKKKSRSHEVRAALMARKRRLGKGYLRFGGAGSEPPRPGIQSRTRPRSESSRREELDMGPGHQAHLTMGVQEEREQGTKMHH